MKGNCPHHFKEILISKLGDLEDVLLTGRFNEKEYYQELANADVLLMIRTNSSFANAGFPYKLGEYIATQNPVICTNVSDISLDLKN